MHNIFFSPWLDKELLSRALCLQFSFFNSSNTSKCIIAKLLELEASNWIEKARAFEYNICMLKKQV